MTNTRSHARYDVALAAEVSTGHQTLVARAKNLSLGGVGLEVREPIAAKQLVLVSLFIVEDGIEDEQAGALDLPGEVVWLNQTSSGAYEGGVRFAPLQHEQLQRLQGFLRRLAM